MRILIAAVIGVLLAGGTSVAVVHVATKTPNPQVKPLYNYGTR
ncbi:hypothetical protein [Actinomadura napierensis]|uniref:DUF2613 family protein n=1 Tax=Actinomadura napierensis TaxID=267854 RepID=A0ABN2Z9T0_9ACTN